MRSSKPWVNILESFVDMQLSEVIPGDHILCSVCYHYPDNDIWKVESIKHTEGSNKWSMLTLSAKGYNKTRVLLDGNCRIRCEHASSITD